MGLMTRAFHEPISFNQEIEIETVFRKREVFSRRTNTLYGTCYTLAIFIENYQLTKRIWCKNSLNNLLLAGGHVGERNSHLRASWWPCSLMGAAHRTQKTYSSNFYASRRGAHKHPHVLGQPFLAAIDTAQTIF